jgi:ABC-type lipoprotein release transport system permease subunit
MGALLAIARSALAAAILHRARSVATIACIVALLTPFVAGLAVAQGLLDEARVAADANADLVVSGLRFGRPAPMPIAAADALRALEGVLAVRPRIVGPIVLGARGESAVLVGLERDALPPDVNCVAGRLFDAEARNEMVVGSRLAQRLALAPGSRIPPFYVNREGERTSTVVGVFRSDLPPWEANVVLASLATAQAYFDERGTANQFLVTCREGYADEVRQAISRMPTLAPGAADPLPPRVVSRAALRATLTDFASFGGGVFALHHVLLFAAAIPLLLVTSGAGLAERRRETGILKMLGWGTDDVLLRSSVESVVLAGLGGATSILLATLWLGPLAGRGIAAVFFPGADASPGFAVPWRLTPGPVLLGLGLALVLVLVGTLHSSWRAAIAEPMEAMR